jgi:hypothetical protein
VKRKQAGALVSSHEHKELRGMSYQCVFFGGGGPSGVCGHDRQA